MFLTEEEAEICSAALELIRDEKHWTTRTTARNAMGWAVETNDPQATQWCASGALAKAEQREIMNIRLRRKLDELSCEMFPRIHRGIIGVNDHLGHDEVISIFEKALVKL